VSTAIDALLADQQAIERANQTLRRCDPQGDGQVRKELGQLVVEDRVEDAPDLSRDILLIELTVCVEKERKRERKKERERVREKESDNFK
jgi:hypothetical protein